MKKISLLYLFIGLIFIFISASCIQKTNPDAEKAIIVKVIHDGIGWALTKDVELSYSIMAQDSNLFIFSPDSASTIIGFDALRKQTETVFMNPAFKATHFEIRNLRITLSQSGTVAWFSCNLDDFCEWDGKKMGWKNARWTGVLEKRSGKWVQTQLHFSFPIDRKRNKNS